MKTNYTICYFSKASNDLTKEDIQKIFNHTDASNKKKGVYGILLYSLGNFFQVLEGDQKYIEPLYREKIKNDDRHTELFEVFNKPSTLPLFSNYSSSFQTIESNEHLDEIKKYLETNAVASTTSEKLSRLLKSFLILE